MKGSFPLSKKNEYNRIEKLAIIQELKAGLSSRVEVAKNITSASHLSPIAETSRPLFPNLRFCIIHLPSLI
ncbi:hypothetical protein E0698_19495 [Paenibacillus sp. 23TSA30-6]|nr:hypothetical protein [Paenibacillus sp. 23TSA30-6]